MIGIDIALLILIIMLAIKLWDCSEKCLKHGYNICNDCFLCEYDVQHNDDKKRCKCLIEWKYDVCYRHEYYTIAPISEILALPEREVTE